MHKHSAVAIALCVAGCSARFARADAPATPVGFPFVTGDVAHATPAPWIKPGAQLTFAISRGVFYFQPDQIAVSKPGEQGCLFIRDDAGNQLTLHAYRNEVTAYLVQMRVIAVSDGKIYVQHARWQLNGQYLLPAPTKASPTDPIGMIEGEYISPDLLKATPDRKTATDTIQHTTETLRGQQVSVYGAIEQTGCVMKSVRYNQETGIAMDSVMQYQSPDAQFSIVGQSARGALVNDNVKFVNQRDIAYPWLGKPAPAWTQKLKAVTLHCELAITDSTVTRPPEVTSTDTKLYVIERGSDWLLLGGYPEGQAPGPGATPIAETIRFAGSTLGPGSLFLPPEGLADLNAGQQIDADPATHVTTTVSSLEKKNGIDVVLFAISGPGITGQYVYNRTTGFLVTMQLDETLLPGKVQHLRFTPTATE